MTQLEQIKRDGLKIADIAHEMGRLADAAANAELPTDEAGMLVYLNETEALYREAANRFGKVELESLWGQSTALVGDLRPFEVQLAEALALAAKAAEGDEEAWEASQLAMKASRAYQDGFNLAVNTAHLVLAAGVAFAAMAKPMSETQLRLLNNSMKRVDKIAGDLFAAIH